MNAAEPASTGRASVKPASTDPASTDPAVRDAVLRLTTGVTVLTTLHDGRPHGSTVSAVNLVLRNPPILSAGLRGGAVLTGLAVAAGQYAVNVLTHRQALLADWFANPDRPAGAGQFERVGWESDPDTGLPVLRHTLATLVCRLEDLVAVGDHELLLGRVISARSGHGSPLVSYGGALYGTEFHDVARRRGWRAPAGASGTGFD
ncbi:flavin reductase family protein [Streptomyces polygonati]|uniref:Flavin reductase family protein n=1 Tax=Streptomyces polygonati TaxID=1617087 RepID=A0ABV8HHP0_9ACTN